MVSDVAALAMVLELDKSRSVLLVTDALIRVARLLWTALAVAALLRRLARRGVAWGGKTYGK
mgnify:CR=1 FL=1